MNRLFLEIWTLRMMLITNALTQESFSLVGETEVRDSKHDRSTICNGQLKDGGSHKLRNVSESDPWSAAPVREWRH